MAKATGSYPEDGSSILPRGTMTLFWFLVVAVVMMVTFPIWVILLR